MRQKTFSKPDNITNRGLESDFEGTWRYNEVVIHDTVKWGNLAAQCGSTSRYSDVQDPDDISNVLL